MLERSVVESLDRFRTYLFRNYSQNLQQARRELPYYLSIQTVSTSADIVSLPYLFTKVRTDETRLDDRFNEVAPMDHNQSHPGVPRYLSSKGSSYRLINHPSSRPAMYSSNHAWIAR